MTPQKRLYSKTKQPQFEYEDGVQLSVSVLADFLQSKLYTKPKLKNDVVFLARIS